jgi:hypothetical protein
MLYLGFGGIYLLSVFLFTVLTLMVPPLRRWVSRRLGATRAYIGTLIIGVLTTLLMLGELLQPHPLLAHMWANIPTERYPWLMGAGYVSLLASPFLSIWSWRRFGRVYYPILLAGLLIGLALQYAALQLTPSPTRHLYCSYPGSRKPEPPQDLQLGDTFELAPRWYADVEAHGNGPPLVTRVPPSILPLGAPPRWQAVQVGTGMLRLNDPGGLLHGGPSEDCYIPLTVHGSPP